MTCTRGCVASCGASGEQRKRSGSRKRCARKARLSKELAAIHDATIAAPKRRGYSILLGLDRLLLRRRQGGLRRFGQFARSFDNLLRKVIRHAHFIARDRQIGGAQQLFFPVA